MKVKRVSLFAVAVVACVSVATSASAITFNPAPPQSYDFGNVLIGDTVTVSYSASWDYSSGESGGSVVAITSSPLASSEFTILNTSNACESGPNIDCTWDLSFAPIFEGASGLRLKVGLIQYISDAGALISTNFAALGTGVSATPLPAAFPLFASGTGALSLMGWRRKRKQAVARVA